MAFKLNPNTLEPENGDFIAFLKAIEKSGSHVQSLQVSMSEESPGMITVTHKKPRTAATSRSGFRSRNAPGLNLLFNAVLALAGILAILVAMFLVVEDFIPAGMITAFGGLVLLLTNLDKIQKSQKAER